MKRKIAKLIEKVADEIIAMTQECLNEAEDEADSLKKERTLIQKDVGVLLERVRGLKAAIDHALDAARRPETREKLMRTFDTTRDADEFVDMLYRNLPLK